MGEFSIFHWLVVLLIFAFYFLLTIVARKKRQFPGVLALDLLLGWTILGWIGALVWALTEQSPPVQVVVQQSPGIIHETSVLCSSCGKYSVAGSKFCSTCGRALAA